jgi:cytochrome c oxidase subunit 2
VATLGERLLAAALAWGLASPAAADPRPETGYGLPHDASLDGHKVDWLLNFTLGAITVIFVVVSIALLVALVRHGRNHPASYQPGSKASIAVVVGSVLLVLFAVDGTLFVHTLLDMRRTFWNFGAAEASPSTVRIEVEAHQWAWQARYPGPDGKFGTQDDATTLNDIRVPAGRPVLIQLASVDVIHSMYLPNFRVKQDAVPGMVTRLTFQAKETGEFEIACAQHCGPNHYKMRGVLSVLPEDRFREWLAGTEADARRAYDPEDTEAHWGWDWRIE